MMNGSRVGIRWMPLALVAAALILAGCARLAALSPEISPSTEPETITVTGYGEARGDPDMLTIEVGVTVSSTDITQAVSSANATIERITAGLAQFGIAAKDVQTTGFNVWSDDVYSPVTGSPSGEKTYRVDSSLRVLVREVDKAGVILEQVIKDGANNIYGMNFSIEDPQPLAAQARTAAVQDARVRATQLAQELGLTLGEVRGASEISGGPIPVYAASGIGGGGEVPVNLGQLTVAVSVEVTFAVSH